MQLEFRALEEASRKQAIYEFMDVCPTEEHEAEYYLDETGFDVEVMNYTIKGRHRQLPRESQ